MAHDPNEAHGHSVILDMQRGLLVSDCRQLSGRGLDVRLRTLRLVSLRERAIGLQVIQLEIERGDIELVLEASFGGVRLGLAAERIADILEMRLRGRIASGGRVADIA